MSSCLHLLSHDAPIAAAAAFRLGTLADFHSRDTAGPAIEAMAATTQDIITDKGAAGLAAWEARIAGVSVHNAFAWVSIQAR